MGGVRSCIVRLGAVGGNGEEATHQTDLALGQRDLAAFARSSPAMGDAQPARRRRFGDASAKRVRMRRHREAKTEEVAQWLSKDV